MPQMAECGGGNPERNDERFLEDWGEPLMATQPKKMFILTSYDETFRSQPAQENIALIANDFTLP